MGGAMHDMKDILSAHEEMRSARQPFEAEWRELARLFAPDDEAMFGGDKSARSRVEDLFDATGIYALDDFGSGLFGQMANPANRWFSVSVADSALRTSHAVSTWCWRVGDIIGRSLAAPASRFYTEAPGWFANLGLYGFGAMFSEEKVGEGRFRDVHVPIGELFFDVNADGEITRVHREMRMKGAKAKRKFPELAEMGTRVSDTADLRIIHCVVENPNPDPRAAGWRGMAWLSYYLSPEVRDFRRVGGYNELPYSIIRWKARPNRAYPSGPGANARPDVSMLQEMERTHLVAAQFAAEPVLLAMDDADIVPADIQPNAVLNGGVTAGGRQSLIPLNRAQNLQLSLEQSRERREAIRRAFFFSILSLINRPQMTATEVEKFDMERLRQMAPYVERIQQEGLTPLLARRFNLLQRAGALPPAPQELEGQPLTIEHVSPLAKLQEIDQARGVLGWITNVSQIAQATGDASIIDNIDPDKAAAVLHRTSGAPPDVRRDPDAIERIRKGRAEAASQATAIEQQAVQVETAATASHAAQAASMAQKRSAA